MKDLAQWLLTQIPKYLSDFVSTFSSPKTFVGARNMPTDDFRSEALTFLAISFVFAVLLHTPLMSDEFRLWEILVLNGVANLLWVILVAAALRLAWWCMGGRAPFTSFLITYCYYFGVTLVLVKILHLCVLGVLKTFQPEVFEILRDFSRGQIPESTEFSSTLPLAILFIGYTGVVIWLIVGWGVYRELNGLSKIRSLWAGIIFSLLCGPLLLFQFFLETILRPQE